MESNLNEGTKYDQGKLRYSLLSTPAIKGLLSVLEYGASKYEPFNWAKGISYSRVYDAVNRHLAAWWSGEVLDPESKLPHLDHAMCGLMFLSHYEKWSMPSGLYDQVGLDTFDDRFEINDVRVEADAKRDFDLGKDDPVKMIASGSDEFLHEVWPIQ